MFSKTWLLQTVEWVLTAVLAGLAAAYVDGGIHSWADLGQAAAGAAAVAVIKCLGASAKGDPQIPAVVEPDPMIRPVVVEVASPAVGTEELLQQVRKQARYRGRDASL